MGVVVEDARVDSQVCVLGTGLLVEWNEAEDEEERCEYVDHGQCGRESGEGRPGELEMACGPGRGDDMGFVGVSDLVERAWIRRSL